MAQTWNILPYSKKKLSAEFYGVQDIIDHEGTQAEYEQAQDDLARAFWDDPNTDRRKPPTPPPWIPR